jgi:hypothetical protein
MRLFHLKYPNCQTLSGKLAWSHYCELIYIEDESARSFYEIECIKSSWGVKELKRQIKGLSIINLLSAIITTY